MKPFALLNGVISEEGDEVESELLKTESSLMQILENYADTVWRLCLVHMRNKADAEDVFQNVFVKLCKKRPSFNDMEHAKAWT